MPESLLFQDRRRGPLGFRSDLSPPEPEDFLLGRTGEGGRTWELDVGSQEKEERGEVTGGDETPSSANKETKNSCFQMFLGNALQKIFHKLTDIIKSHARAST